MTTIRLDDLAADLDIQIVLNSIGGVGDASYANSAYLVTREGVDPRRYDKVQLVPFGEYVPFFARLAFTESLVREVGHFTPGRTKEPLASSPSMGIAICYEVVFADLMAAQARGGAEVLVSITNDGWYGYSWAPSQHFAHVVLRAVENRRWFARAALTGISGFVEPSGRLGPILEVGEQGLLVAEVRLATDMTPRSRFGDWWCVAAALAGSILLICGRMRTPRG